MTTRSTIGLYRKHGITKVILTKHLLCFPKIIAWIFHSNSPRHSAVGSRRRYTMIVRETPFQNGCAYDSGHGFASLNILSAWKSCRLRSEFTNGSSTLYLPSLPPTRIENGMTCQTVSESRTQSSLCGQGDRISRMAYTSKSKRPYYCKKSTRIDDVTRASHHRLRLVQNIGGHGVWKSCYISLTPSVVIFNSLSLTTFVWSKQWRFAVSSFRFNVHTIDTPVSRSRCVQCASIVQPTLLSLFNPNAKSIIDI